MNPLQSKEVKRKGFLLIRVPDNCLNISIPGFFFMCKFDDSLRETHIKRNLLISILRC